MTAAPTHPQPNGSAPLSPTSTSVFNALGSYADRIRDKDMKDGQLSTGGAASVSSKKSPKPPAATDLPNGSTSTSVQASGSSSAKPIKADTMAPPPAPKAGSSSKPRAVKEKDAKENEKEPEPAKEEEAAWETVPAGKSRRKEKESPASSNWRDRPREPKEKRESSAWRSGADDEKVKGEGRKKAGQSSSGSTATQPTSSTTRSTSTHTTPSTSAPTPAPVNRSASVTPASTTRKAWGIVTPSPSVPSPLAASTSTSSSNPLPGQTQQTPITTPAPKPATSHTPKSAPTTRTVTPPSPSITGASTAVNGSVASPNLSATTETASTATMVTPHGGREDDEDWRVRPRKLSMEMVENGSPTPATAGKEESAEKEKVVEPEIKEIPKAAAPPPTNAWAERKKAMGTSDAPISSPSLPAFPAATSSGNIGSKASTGAPSSSATMANKTAVPGKSTALLFGSVEINETKAVPNGHAEGSSPGASGEAGVKVGSLKKKKQPLAASGPRHVVDTNAFPDLAQAAKPKKEAGRKEKDSEGSLVDDAAAHAARKTKWTAIPATELLAAADEAKRHAQATASRQKQQQASSHPRPLPSSTSGIAESSLSHSKAPRKKSLETRKARVARSGSGSEIRLPPNPLRRNSGSTVGGGAGDALTNVVKPVFGSVNGGDGDQGASTQQQQRSPQKEEVSSVPMSNGATSDSVSRQSTSASRLSSPLRPRTQLPSPNSTEQKDQPLPPITDMPGVRLGTGPLSAHGNGSMGGNGGAMGSNTSPMPQSGFPSSGNGTQGAGIPRLTKPTRRQSFTGPPRGRGGYRGGYRSSMGVGMGESGYLPNGLSRGGGHGGSGGFHTFVPQQQQHGSTSMANGASNGGSGGYDPSNQVMYAVWDPVQGYAMPSIFGTPGGAQGRQGLPLPPPPMPVTQSVGLDALRFYVLGQVEYYFSMQNLAMDFFLRQQMDSEGWIDISMITSFNRIKSLTPDLTIIKEVMLLSSILEVREDKVRLSHGESKRWILPDAKPSPFVDDGSSAGKGDEDEGELGLIGYGSIPIANGDGAAVMGLGLEGREVLVKGVENALMRPRDPITGLLSTPSVATTTTELEMGTDAGTDVDEAEGDEREMGLGLMKDGGVRETTGTSSSASEEAEKVELR